MSVKAPYCNLEPLIRLAVLAFGILPLEALAQTGSSSEPITEPVVVSVVLNGTVVADAQLLHRELGRSNSRVWFPTKEAQSWRMDLAGRTQRSFENLQHAAFCGQRDICFYDESSALLTITLKNIDILPLHIAPPQLLQDTATESTGGYLNYDLTAWHTGRPGASVLLEGRVYSPHGHGAIRAGGVLVSGGGTRTLTQAVWQIDRPQQGISLQAGSITVPDTPLGAGLPLTGLRVGSNARLQPTVSHMLRPRIEGIAERALRADVFADGLYRQTAQIPYGPYSIELQPQYPGRGDMDLVTTEITGLQARNSQPYYHAPQMLTPGASEWSLDVGVLANLGLQTTARPPALAAAMVRRGLSRQLTAQAQVLLAESAKRFTLAAETAAPSRGYTSLGVIWQRAEAQPRGQLWLSAGHEYLAQDMSLVVKTEQSLGSCHSGITTQPLTDRLWRPCNVLSSGFSINLGSRWSVSAAIEARRENTARYARIASLGARLQTGARNQLALSLQKITVNQRSSTGVYVIWSQPLGNNYDAQVSLQQRHGEKASLQWSVQSLPPPDAQTEMRRFQTYGSVGQYNELGGRWTQRTAESDWRIEAQANRRNVSTSVGVSGAVGLAEGRVFTSRRIDDAFIVVDVGLPDLPVLLDNREVARTNAQGWAIVTEGRAYQANNVGVDTSTLPIEYAMPRDQQNVVPAGAAGVLARFDISDGGIAVPVQNADGQWIPAGAAVSISTQRLPTAVTSRGEVFFERSDRAAEVTIEWNGERCRFRYQPQEDPPEGYRCIPLP